MTSPTLHPSNSRLRCACPRYVEHSLKRIVAFHEPGCPGSSVTEQLLGKQQVEGLIPSPGSDPKVAK